MNKQIVEMENLNLPKTFTDILDLLDDCIFIVDKNGYFVFITRLMKDLINWIRILSLAVI